MEHEGMRRVGGAIIPDVSRVQPPHGRQYWVTEEMLPHDRTGVVKPTFTIAQVAQVFFARSGDWIRYLEGLGEEALMLDGKILEPRRTISGSRYYTLSDVEKMAHALLQNQRIDVMQFIAVIELVRWMAFQNRMIPERDMIIPDLLDPGDMPGESPIPGMEEQEPFGAQ